MGDDSAERDAKRRAARSAAVSNLPDLVEQRFLAEMGPLLLE